MRTIIDIYNEYKIPPNLQIHQLQVAAVALQICDSTNLSIDKENVIKACLLHDMANIVKYDLHNEYSGLEIDDLDYWRVVQKEYIEKYGADDHQATYSLIKEMNLPEPLFKLLEKNLQLISREDINMSDVESCICKYADMRLSPHGVMPLKERLEEWQRRASAYVSYETMYNIYEIYKQVEEKIFTSSSIKPEDINDNSIANRVEKLRNTNIL
jgi:hypothetical protein